MAQTQGALLNPASLGSRTAVGSAEEGGGNFALTVDINELVADEFILLEVEMISVAAGTYRVVDTVTVNADSTSKIIQSIAYVAAHGVRFFLTQSNGSIRDFQYSIDDLS